jgi:hypothetical protein
MSVSLAEIEICDNSSHGQDSEGQEEDSDDNDKGEEQEEEVDECSYNSKEVVHDEQLTVRILSSCGSCAFGWREADIQVGGWVFDGFHIRICLMR